MSGRYAELAMYVAPQQVSQANEQWLARILELLQQPRVDHPVATVLLTFALVLVGLIAFPQLPVASLNQRVLPLSIMAGIRSKPGWMPSPGTRQFRQCQWPAPYAR